MARGKTDKTDTTPAATFATTATRAANEWGIPDWRDAAAYGDVKRWTFNRWRWEFYRRRDDLREYFDTRADETYHERKQYEGTPGHPVTHLKPHEPGFYAFVDAEARALFGYRGLPNPRIGGQPALAISPWVSDGVVKYWDGGMSGVPGWRDTLGEYLDRRAVTLTDEQAMLLGSIMKHTPVNLERHEVAVAFDLNRPLEPQLETARIMLRADYEFHSKPQQRKRHPAKWLGYLRTLDAREAGASWREIAIALLPMRDDEAGERVHARETKARDLWKAANDLRFNF